FELNFWMRLLPESTTNTLPSDATASPFGVSKVPVDVPKEPVSAEKTSDSARAPGGSASASSARTRYILRKDTVAAFRRCYKRGRDMLQSGHSNPVDVRRVPRGSLYPAAAMGSGPARKQRRVQRDG